MKFTVPQSYIEEGLIRVVSHPSLPLRLFNYTEHCQFEKKWDDITLQCRGLVVDAEDNIVARPFKKFFNYEEFIGQIPPETPEIIEKVDGSLGIVFYYANKWHVATRGSFTSEQAQHAQMVLDGKYADASFCLPTNVTHLFEIVYPANRIVVDYGTKDDLVYLGSVFIETGDDTECQTAIDHFPTAARLGVPTNDLLGLKRLESANAEGFVLKWPNGFRLKLKFEEYKRLHRILTNTTERSIWEAMKEGQDLRTMVESVPDEFHQWFMETTKKIQDEYNRLCRESFDQVHSIRTLHAPQTRKEWAELITKYAKNPSLCFGHLDGRDISRQVWMMIKPAATKPFKTES